MNNTILSNTTSSISQTIAETWSYNSLQLSYAGGEDLCIVALIFGGVVLLHSFYLHRFKFHTVRICSDLAALSMMAEASLFYSCLAQNCSTGQVAIRYNFSGNAVFGLICQLCDNYITFARYSIVSGGASTIHGIFAFLYVFIFLVLSWWLFFTIFPFFYDMNSDEWIYWQLVFATWVNFITYLVYNFSYLALVIRIILQIQSSTTIPNERKRKLTALSIRAMCHTCFSVIGIFLYSFYIPFGILEQNIFITAGIHIFLNWNFKLSFFNKVGTMNADEGTDKYKVIQS